MFKSLDTSSLLNRKPYEPVSLLEVKQLLKDKSNQDVQNLFQDLEANIATFRKIQKDQKILLDQAGCFWTLLEDSEHLPIRRRIYNLE
jgi:hypothetical protein